MPAPKINVALRIENQADRVHRLVSLTDAWFNDVEALAQPSLILFDTYEQATTEVKNWISGPFLSRVTYSQRVRVVIAGQEVPNLNNIEWSHCCDAHDLYGVREAEHWMPIVQAMKRRIPFDNAQTWLAGYATR